MFSFFTQQLPPYSAKFRDILRNKKNIFRSFRNVRKVSVLRGNFTLKMSFEELKSVRLRDIVRLRVSVL